MAEQNPSAQSHLLTADYSSPGNASFTFTEALAAPPTASASDRTSYLASLRKATKTLQDTINAELTLRMEEDNARAAAGSASKSKNAIDEAKEEDNYGEEIVEED